MDPGSQDLKGPDVLPPEFAMTPKCSFPCFLKLPFIGHSVRAEPCVQHSTRISLFYPQSHSAGMYCCWSHFLDKQTEAERGEMTCLEPISHRAGSDQRFLTRVFGGRLLAASSLVF